MLELIMILIAFVFLGLIVFQFNGNFESGTNNAEHYNSNKITSNTASQFSFPLEDSNKNKLCLPIEFNLSGYTHEHFGYSPQNTIPNLNIGQRVILKEILDNEYDANAVAVFDLSNRFIGWIPSGKNKDIFNILLNKQTIYARISRINHFDTCWTACIEIAVYCEEVKTDDNIEPLKNSLYLCELCNDEFIDVNSDSKHKLCNSCKEKIYKDLKNLENKIDVNKNKVDKCNEPLIKNVYSSMLLDLLYDYKIKCCLLNYSGIYDDIEGKIKLLKIFSDEN